MFLGHFISLDTDNSARWTNAFFRVLVFVGFIVSTINIYNRCYSESYHVQGFLG